MNTQIQPTVTIGISALNEEKNISKIIHSILEQNINSFILKEIVVVSDGSTDNTITQSKTCNDSRITVIEHKNRKGKPTRLNEIFTRSETDVLVLIDADVLFENSNCLEALVETLCESEPVQLVGGAIKPLPGKTFIEKAINVSFDAYQRAILQYKNGNVIYTASGRLLGLKKSFYKELMIPNHMIRDDKFVYLYCVNKGYSYRYVPHARVLFRSPQTLKEHVSQNTRYTSDSSTLLKYFPQVILDKLYYFPKGLLRKELFRELLLHPIFSVSIFSINFYCKLRAKYLADDIHDAKWKEVTTSKELIQ